jgi:hypothetical protein
VNNLATHTGFDVKVVIYKKLIYLALFASIGISHDHDQFFVNPFTRMVTCEFLNCRVCIDRNALALSCATRANQKTMTDRKNSKQPPTRHTTFGHVASSELEPILSHMDSGQDAVL